ncbi:unnamed protein product [Brachionus calyciflorus]|uniref:Uncharacterized protein n=1 Tax=Brachionus calyciflorus TaxID=104777 RepID=A0A813MM91_9BILA|nr:unnamed protein product [Brachionus calyciflorus]
MMITRTTGMSMTVAGSATSLTGVLLAPTTFGLSVSLTIGGTVIGAIGSIANIWGSVKKDLITRMICKEAECMINELKQHTKEFIEIFTNTHFRRQMENGLGGLLGKCAQEGLNLANLFTNVLASQNATSATFLLNPNIPLHYMGIGISLFFTSLELVRLIETTIDLKDGIKDGFSDQIRKFALELEQNANDLEDFIYQEFNLGLRKVKEC